MKLAIYRHLWGITESWESLFPKIRALGYNGIEHILPDGPDERRFMDALRQNGFTYIAQVITNGRTVQEHLESFRGMVDRARDLGPEKINCHSGADFFSEDDARRFYGEALNYEAKTGALVAHETHRGRVFYNPWITERILKSFPELKLSCDFSHWVVVCERLLETEVGIIKQCAEQCAHIHARIGYEEGPQVPDPRAPEHLRHVEAHEHWWDLIWDAQERKGDVISTMTPEFGAPDYLHTLPYTRSPVADLWDICNWQAHRQRARFEARRR